MESAMTEVQFFIVWTMVTCHASSFLAVVVGLSAQLEISRATTKSILDMQEAFRKARAENDVEAIGTLDRGTTMSKAQQLLTMDEIDAGRIEQEWLQAVGRKYKNLGRPDCEVTQERMRDTCVTTIWLKNQPVAVAVRQRNDWNYTVLTMTEIEPMKVDLSPVRS
jgi:hypothetical protein